MAKISSYPSDANVTTSDRLIGTDNENSNETKNFEIGDIIDLAETIITPGLINTYVPYTGAVTNVNLGPNTLTVQNAVVVGDLNVTGGLRMDSNAGAAGSVLMSAGSGVTPVWYDLTSIFVPYTGATGDVNLGANGLFANDIRTSIIYPTIGTNNIYVGDSNISNPSGLFLDLAANSYYLGDYDGVYNGTSIVIQDTSERILFQGGFNLSNGQGTAGQVLESLGAGNTPQWVNVNTLVTSSLFKGNFYDSITQTLAAPNTATPVILRNTDAPTTNGISIVTDGTNLSRITFANAGTYNILFSAQLANSGGTGQTVDFWLRKNGSTAAANIPHTNGKVQLQGNASFLMAAWNYFVNVNAGDYIQLMWTATSTNITMVAAAANGVHPETPSIIVTANVV
jgi:hypothetical protein